MTTITSSSERTLVGPMPGGGPRRPAPSELAAARDRIAELEQQLAASQAALARELDAHRVTGVLRLAAEAEVSASGAVRALHAELSDRAVLLGHQLAAAERARLELAERLLRTDADLAAEQATTARLRRQQLEDSRALTALRAEVAARRFADSFERAALAITGLRCTDVMAELDAEALAERERAAVEAVCAAVVPAPLEQFDFSDAGGAA